MHACAHRPGPTATPAWGRRHAAQSRTLQPGRAAASRPGAEAPHVYAAREAEAEASI
jgi:hypothetical protein